MSMEYKLKSETNNQFIFKEVRALMWLIWLFPIIGLPVFLLGFLALLVDLTEGNGVEAMDLILTGFGFTFTMAVGIMWTSRNSNPFQIVFDNSKGVVRLHQKRKDKTEATTELPYDEIDGFYIRSEMGSSSSSGTRSTRYVVYWMKKDGSIWDLCSYNNRAKAETFQQKLIQGIQLNQSAQISKEAQLPESISLKKSVEGIALEWQNKITSKFVFFVLVFIGFCLIDAGLFINWQQGESGTPFFIMTPFLTVIGGLMVYYSFKNMTTIYRLVITDSELIHEHVRNGQPTTKKSILLTEIAAISFDFKQVVGGSPLKILNHHEFGQIQNTLGGDFNVSDIGKLISMAMKSFQINIDALDVVDKVDLEKILQKVILEKGGVDVL